MSNLDFIGKIQAMKWPETLIIQNHQMCNLRCSHCQGPDAERKPISLQPLEILPNRISLAELKKVIIFFNNKGLIGNERIVAIRFGGNWSEPTLDSELSAKVDFLLDATEGTSCQISVLTNGINIPSGLYNQDLMREYFLFHFGFEEFPERFSLKPSIDDEHLESYIRRRNLETEIDRDVATQEYKEKVLNLVHHAELHGNAQSVHFNTVKPTNAPPNFEERWRQKFGIPKGFRVFTLKRAIYTHQQENLEHAVDLARTLQPPLNTERCYFLAKKKNQLLLYPNIVSFGFETDGVPYRNFGFPEAVDLEI